MANLNISDLPPLSGFPDDDALLIVQQGAGTFRVTGAQLRAAYGGSGGGSGGITDIQPGQGIAVDETDPAIPVVSANLEAGANVTFTAGAAPNSIRISASGGGGGGSGQVTFVQIAKVAPGSTLTGAEVNTAGATPFVISNQANLDLLLDDMVGTFLVVFRAFGAPLTLTNPTGANMFDQGSSALSAINLVADETVQMIMAGDGVNWSGYVLTRY